MLTTTSNMKIFHANKLSLKMLSLIFLHVFEFSCFSVEYSINIKWYISTCKSRYPTVKAIKLGSENLELKFINHHNLGKPFRLSGRELIIKKIVITYLNV